MKEIKSIFAFNFFTNFHAKVTKKGNVLMDKYKAKIILFSCLGGGGY